MSDETRRARTLGCVAFGQQAARAIFEAKGSPSLIVLDEEELTAILAVVADRVSETGTDQVALAALRQLGGDGGLPQ